MKKLMALCLSLLMVLSMCSFTAMAATVGFEVISNGQSANFVVNQLVLNGYTLTSSNTDVITTEGEVIRPYFEDVQVNLSFTNGTDSGTATVTVPSSRKDIKSTETFTAEEDFTVGTSYTAPFDKWNRSNGLGEPTTKDVNGAAVTIPASAVIKDGVMNVSITKYTDSDNATDDGTSFNRTNIVYTLDKPTADETIGVRFDAFDFADVVSYGVDIRPSVKVYDKDNNEIAKISGSAFWRATTTVGFAGQGGWAPAAASESISIEYNPTTGEFWGNGVLSTENLINDANYGSSGKSAADAVRVVIESITFTNGYAASGGTFKLDNLVEYTVLTDDEVVAKYPAAQLELLKEYLSEEYVSNGGSLKAFAGSRLNLTADEPLPEGTTLTWTSTDSNVVDPTTGNVSRDIEKTKTVSITGTLALGGATVTETHTVTVLAATILSSSEILNGEHGLNAGQSVIGQTGWPTSLTYAYESINIEQEGTNKFYRYGINSYQPTGSTPKYQFQTLPTVGADAEKYVLEFKVRIPAETANAALANFSLKFNGSSSEVAEFIYYNGYLYDNAYDLGTDDYHGPSNARNDVLVTKGSKWYDLKIETDIATKTVTCYIDGNPVGSYVRSSFPDTIASARFEVKGRYNANATDTTATKIDDYFDVDDIQLYTTTSAAGAFNALSDAAKVAYYKKWITEAGLAAVAAGKVLDLDAGYAEYNPTEFGGSVVWTSSDTNYIENGTGRVLKYADITSTSDASVNMTATITFGSVTDTVVFPVTIGKGTTSIVAYTYDTEADGYYTYTSEDTSSTEKSTKIGNDLYATVSTDLGARLVIRAKVKYTPNDPASEDAEHGQYWDNYGGIGFHGIAGEPNSLGVFFRPDSNEILLSTTSGHINGAGNALETGQKTTVSYPMPARIKAKITAGEWINVIFDYNALSQTYIAYVDNEKVNEVPIARAAAHQTTTGSGIIRTINAVLLRPGTVCIDDVSFEKYTDADYVEADAAINAAALVYAAKTTHPVMVDGTLLDKTSIIGKAFKGTGKLNIGENTTAADYLANPAFYPASAVEGAPTLSYKVNGVPAASIVATKPDVIDFTITSTGAATLSKTFKVPVAPVAIRGLAISTTPALNGILLEGQEGNERVVVAQYKDNMLATVTVHSLTGNENYKTEISALAGLGTLPPVDNPDSDQVKIFVIGSDGITPVAFANTDLWD